MKAHPPPEGIAKTSAFKRLTPDTLRAECFEQGKHKLSLEQIDKAYRHAVEKHGACSPPPSKNTPPRTPPQHTPISPFLSAQVAFWCDGHVVGSPEIAWHISPEHLANSPATWVADPGLFPISSESLRKGAV